jgi:uncharacterized protein (TIGR00251 family)
VRPVVLTIRVIPRAGKPGPAGMRDGAFLIRLCAPPVEGAANAELIDILSDLLDIPKRNISIVSGERSRTKRVQVIGIDEASAHARLR